MDGAAATLIGHATTLGDPAGTVLSPLHFSHESSTSSLPLTGRIFHDTRTGGDFVFASVICYLIWLVPKDSHLEQDSSRVLYQALLL
jgi:hypothetical protein